MLQGMLYLMKIRFPFSLIGFLPINMASRIVVSQAPWILPHYLQIMPKL